MENHCSGGMEQVVYGDESGDGDEHVGGERVDDGERGDGGERLGRVNVVMM